MNAYSVIPAFILSLVLLVICGIGLVICEISDKIKKE